MIRQQGTTGLGSVSLIPMPLVSIPTGCNTRKLRLALLLIVGLLPSGLLSARREAGTGELIDHYMYIHVDVAQRVLQSGACGISKDGQHSMLTAALFCMW